MNIKNIKKEDISTLLLDKEMNIAAAQGLFEFCFYSADHKFDHNNYASSIADFMELNMEQEEDVLFYNTRIKPSVRKVDIKDYEDNYYRKNIKPSYFKGNGYELCYLTINPYQALPIDDITVDKNYIEVSRIGYFDKPFSYLTVKKDDVVWMSTDPNEINTMKESIDEASGDVLAFGLGLGYFPIMCAVKPNVKSVTVVEKDKNIIDIFNKHILPLFEHKDKIKIICADAYDYVNRNDLSKFNYLFIDIWHNAEDGLPLYLKFRRMLKREKIKVSYWLETSLLAMFRRCLLTVVEESLSGYSDKDYKKAKNDYDVIINDLYFRTKNMTFNSIDELKKILQDSELVNLV